MKTITYSEVDGQSIIKNIENALIDPAETEKRVAALISQNPGILSSEKTKDALIAENIVFVRMGPNQKNVTDAEGRILQSIFATLNGHEKLLLSGEKIVDMRGTAYWIKQSGNWEKLTVEVLGENIPSDALLPDDLNLPQYRAQKKEIDEQTEADRIAALTPAEKTKEKETALAAARHDVRILKEDADAVDEPFDAPAEYQSRKAKIEEKYV